jgi:HK97 family phage prohead protease
MPQKTSEREYRRIDVANLETRTEDDGQMIVEGYASTFNQPYTLADWPDFRLDERIDPHAFDETDMDDVIMQYDHEGRVFARKRNGTLQVSTDDHGLKIRARLDGTTIGRQLYEEIKGGYTDRMSFGFTVGEDRREETEDHETGKVTVLRTITKVKKLFDVSAVSLPANDATEISARNLSDGLMAEITEERRALEERKRKVQKIKIMLEVQSHEND